jgi:serine/threonine protein kinase
MLAAAGQNGAMLGESFVDSMAAREWVRGLGQTFEVFDLQDSGHVCYGVDRGAERVFVKCATTPPAAEGLERAARLHRDVVHPALVAPTSIVRFADGMAAMVFPWCDGTVLYPATKLGRAIRTHPDGPWVRFRALPVERAYTVIETLLDAHLAVTAAGYLAVDLYDGCLLYDFHAHRMRLVDLDEYRPGPFRLEADRLPGSTRFMAPEEFRRGAVIDVRTTVFALGRAIRLLLDATDVEEQFRGTEEQLAVVASATRSDPAERYADVAALAKAWRATVA